MKNVWAFTQRHVPKENWKTFIRLMKEWDGSDTVLDAFYEEGVLLMKAKEAKEIDER